MSFRRATSCPSWWPRRPCKGKGRARHSASLGSPGVPQPARGAAPSSAFPLVHHRSMANISILFGQVGGAGAPAGPPGLGAGAEVAPATIPAGGARSECRRPRLRVADAGAQCGAEGGDLHPQPLPARAHLLPSRLLQVSRPVPPSHTTGWGAGTVLPQPSSPLPAATPPALATRSCGTSASPCPPARRWPSWDRPEEVPAWPWPPGPPGPPHTPRAGDPLASTSQPEGQEPA